MVDLDAYFARILYAGSPRADIATLRVLHRLHPASIPFENLDPLMGRAVRLDASSLEAKLVRGGRGGYCQEQNGLFQMVLAALGFEITGLAARVIPAGGALSTMARTHRLLRVHLPEGDHIADVGFGSLTLTAPLRLVDGAQETPNGIFRLVPREGGYEQQSLYEDAWRPLYRFSLEPQTAGDYEVANWFTATHPASPFVARLMAARTEPHRRLGMLNNQFSIHTGGATEKRRLATAEEMARVLEREFAITLPEPRGELLAALAKTITG